MQTIYGILIKNLFEMIDFDICLFKIMRIMLYNSMTFYILYFFINLLSVILSLPLKINYRYSLKIMFILLIGRCL